MPDTNSENSFKNWILLVVLTLIWGSSFILIKRGLEVFSPGEVGAYRMVAAASLLLPLSLPRIKQLSKTQVKNLLITGLLGSFIPAFLFPHRCIECAYSAFCGLGRSTFFQHFHHQKKRNRLGHRLFRCIDSGDLQGRRRMGLLD
jgi:hypothetical protein